MLIDGEIEDGCDDRRRIGWLVGRHKGRVDESAEGIIVDLPVG